MAGNSENYRQNVEWKCTEDSVSGSVKDGTEEWFVCQQAESEGVLYYFVEDILQMYIG